MCTLHLDLKQARWLYQHLASDERLVAQRIRDLVGFEIKRMEDIAAFREGQPAGMHVARTWE